MATIADSKEESIKDEVKDNSDIRIYMDGSGFKDNIGAAAVLYRKGAKEPENTEYLSLTEAMNNDANSLPPTGMVKSALSWVAAHQGVAGNERVDEEAKKAAQGESSLLEKLPPILCRQLPYSASAVKQEFANLQKVRWREAWQDSPHYARLQHINPNFPFNKFRKLSEQLSRSQASLMMQLWTGHIPLNFYLHHIKKSATRHCKSCWGIVRLEVTETVIHFLFECQVYTAERYDMDRALGRQSRDFQGIMSSLD